jgi:hypothetical protein
MQEAWARRKSTTRGRGRPPRLALQGALQASGRAACYAGRPGTRWQRWSRCRGCRARGCTLALSRPLPLRFQGGLGSTVRAWYIVVSLSAARHVGGACSSLTVAWGRHVEPRACRVGVARGDEQARHERRERRHDRQREEEHMLLCQPWHTILTPCVDASTFSLHCDFAGLSYEVLLNFIPSPEFFFPHLLQV